VYNGEKYVQIDTYGRATRNMPEKISQSLQFDKESAAFISRRLDDTFRLSQEK
jgi:hypothetical protein